MDHKTVHGQACICHSCAPAGRWDIPACRGGNPGTPEREAYNRERLPNGPVRTLTEQWCEPPARRRAPRPGHYHHLT